MDTNFLAATDLFQGIAPEEIGIMLACMQAKEQRYRKGEWVYRAGGRVSAIGMVLHGSVTIEKSDVWGNRTILDSVPPGQVFAETYACVPGEALLVDVVAREDTCILLIGVSGLVQPCPHACAYHSCLIRNLLYIASLKNLKLSRRSFYTASRSLRGRLLAYLSDQAAQAGSCTFDIPFDRQQLADYLNVDRSALSGELSKLRREGVLRSTRNHFTLLAESGESEP